MYKGRAKTIKVEQQLLRKSSSKIDRASSNSYVKKDFKKEKEEPHKNLDKEHDKGKGETYKHTHTSDIKCFNCLGRGHIAAQCPTKRTIILRGIDHYSSQDSSTCESESESSPESNGDDAYPCQGKLLMIRRLLNNQPSIDHITQKENIFYTRCNVSRNLCSHIVDSGSCCNYYSTRLVEKLNLVVLPHPKPYKLH